MKNKKLLALLFAIICSPAIFSQRSLRGLLIKDDFVPNGALIKKDHWREATVRHFDLNIPIEKYSSQRFYVSPVLPSKDSIELSWPQTVVPGDTVHIKELWIINGTIWLKIDSPYRGYIKPKQHTSSDVANIDSYKKADFFADRPEWTTLDQTILSPNGKIYHTLAVKDSYWEIRYIYGADVYESPGFSSEKIAKLLEICIWDDELFGEKGIETTAITIEKDECPYSNCHRYAPHMKHWYKIKYRGIIGWVFGSDLSHESDRCSPGSYSELLPESYVYSLLNPESELAF